MSTSLDFRVKNGLIVGSDATVTGSVTATSFTGAGTGLTGGGTSGDVTLSIDSTVTTLTGSQTLTNKTLTTPQVNYPIIKSPEENCTVSATAATGTINFDTVTQGVLYYTSNASANWTVNFRGDGTTTIS